MFGLWTEAPESGFAWGARAIFQSGGYVDLVWDRQTIREGRVCEGFFEPDRERFFVELNGPALQAMRKEAKTLSGSSDETITFYESKTLILKGSCRKSHGYLYLIAYRPQQ